MISDNQEATTSWPNKAVKLGGLVTILVVACVIVVASVPSNSVQETGRHLNMMKNAEETYVPANTGLWRLDDENKFRLGVERVAKAQGEGRFVDLLVNEWKLAQTANMKADGYFVVYPGQCSNALGGGGGGAFSYHDGEVDHFCGRSGSLIDAIHVHFSNGHVLTAGGGGGGYFCYTPPSGQCIKTINIRTGSLVDGIQFVASNGHASGWYGGHGGSYHTVTSTSCLKGVTGRSGSLIDQLAFCF